MQELLSKKEYDQRCRDVIYKLQSKEDRGALTFSKDKIIKNDYESFNQYNLVYKHNRFTGDQVKNYLDLAYQNDEG